MDEKSLQQKIDKGEIKVIPEEPAPAVPAQPDFDPNEDLIALLRQVRQPLGAAPTAAPRNFLEQLQLYAGGLYAYINKSWVSIGSKAKVNNAVRLYSAGVGNQAITNVGFRPKSVKIIAMNPTANGATSTGFASGSSSQNCVERYFDGTDWQNAIPGGLIHVRNGGGSLIQTASLVSFDADGFTINWGQFDGTSSISFLYECLA